LVTTKKGQSAFLSTNCQGQMQTPQSASVHHTTTLWLTRTFLRPQNLPYHF